MDKPATLRSLAVKCRMLADFTVSPNDKQVLQTAAEDFDTQAANAERAGRKLQRFGASASGNAIACLEMPARLR